jgi:hypothetical protein
MAALTGTRVLLVQPGKIKSGTFPLAVAAKAFEGGMACFDTAAYGALKQGAVSTTLQAIGRFSQNVDNTAGGANVPVGVVLDREHDIEYWDSVGGGGAITIANLFQPVYIASDHELTTVATGASIYGRVWLVGPQGYPGGIGVEPLF